MIEAPDDYRHGDPLLKPNIVARRLGVHTETIYRWMRRGFLPFVALGPRRKFVRESEVARILAQRKAA
jgi:excisionase family DNA binding protein